MLHKRENQSHKRAHPMADTHSPYDDHTPLAVPGVAEVREYQAFGVLHDQQIGQASDIVSVTFGG
jgi:hypothetical protein